MWGTDVYSPAALPPQRQRKAHAEYEFRAVGREGDSLRLDITKDGEILLQWRGRVARRLLEWFEKARCRDGSATSVRISKHALQELALRAAAIEIQLRDSPDDRLDQQVRANERLWLRLRELGCRIPPFHARAAQVLYRYPNAHLGEADALSLLSVEYPAVDSGKLSAVTTDLARWGVIQRIEVGGMTFYDTNTAPHLHIYRTSTRELEDAPATGVLSID